MRVGVCLKQQSVFPFSPSAFQASLQTSIFQVSNRTTGAAMSVFNKSDVKDHLHLPPRFYTKMHLYPPLSQPDATGFSVAEPDAIRAKSSDFAEDFLEEHSSIGVAVAPTHPVTGSIAP